MSEQIKVIAYLRVSTESQKKVSLGVQDERIDNWAKSHGYKVIKTISEIRSGRLAKRRGLEDAVALACETGATIVTYDMSRLFRSARLALNTFDKLERHGAAFASVSDDVNTRNNSAYAKLLRTILSAIGEFTSDQCGEKIAMSNHQAIRERKCEQWPHGYRTNGPQPGEWKLVNGVRVPCEESRASIAACRQALSEVNKSFGKYARAAKLLNERGVPTVSSIWAKRAGRENRKSELWTVAAVRWWAMDEKERDRIRKKRNEAKRKARRSFGMEVV